MNFISKWIWKRAIRNEMRSVARTVALVAGLAMIISGVIGTTSLAAGLVLGVGAILIGGQLKHRLWSAALLLAGLVTFSLAGGILGQGGAFLLIVAAALGLASTLF